MVSFPLCKTSVWASECFRARKRKFLFFVAVLRAALFFMSDIFPLLNRLISVVSVKVFHPFCPRSSFLASFSLLFLGRLLCSGNQARGGRGARYCERREREREKKMKVPGKKTDVPSGTGGFARVDGGGAGAEKQGERTGDCKKQPAHRERER